MLSDSKKIGYNHNLRTGEFLIIVSRMPISGVVVCYNSFVVGRQRLSFLRNQRIFLHEKLSCRKILL